MDSLNTAKTRYTTKAYDASKKIPKEQFEKLLEILRFSPSSVNIQPWHFLIAETDEAKQRIAAGLTGSYAYNAAKVLNSSHTLVFCRRTDISMNILSSYLNKMMSVAALRMRQQNRDKEIPVRVMLSFTEMN